MMLILNVFWVFLYYGFSKLENKAYYFIVLGNLVFYTTVSMSTYVKLCFSIKFLTWSTLSTFIIALQVVNYLFFCANLKKSKSDFNSKPNDFLINILDFIVYLAFLASCYLTGRYLDNNLIQEFKVFIYIFVWLFCVINLLKNFYRIGKITTYFEWKKKVLI